MNRHSIIKCSCGKVIAQCRCMGPKTETIRPHPACEAAPAPAPARAEATES